MRNKRTWQVVALFIAFYLWGWFNANYSTRFQAPVVIELRNKKEALPVKNKTSEVKPIIEVEAKQPETDLDIIAKQKHASILYKVYQLESSSGKNDLCKDKNKFNGYGYGQNSFVWNCFDSFEEVTIKVNNWFDKYLTKGYTLEESLCFYNTGIRQPMCNYSIQYNSI